MFGRIRSFFDTVKYLQPAQVRYQLWYRIKTGFVQLHQYKKYLSHTLYPTPVANKQELIPSAGKYTGNLSFSFLNIAHQFDSRIDWNYMEHGKLWNYNLQYFDFLHDPSVSKAEKEFLIEDFAARLLDGAVKAEPYPVSLRLVNWILYYTDTNYRSDQFERCLKLQVDYLQSNLELHIKANHLLENFIALSFSALALRDNELSDFAFSGLKQQVYEQVLPDGGHYECTPMYHSILLGKLLLLISALEKNIWYHADNSWLKKKAGEMMGWLEAFCFADDSFAMVNDATNDIAPSVAEVRSIVSGNGITTASKELKESGYRKMVSDQFEMLVDVGDIIPVYQPGHAHSDMLSFCLQYHNKPVFVDTGVSTYQGNQQRATERGTSAHNTVVINNTNQSEVWGSFRVGRRARIFIHTEQSNHIEASHDGYKKKFGVIHNRSFSFAGKNIVITDRLTGAIPDNAIAYFHLNHGVTVKVNEVSSCIEIDNRLTVIFAGSKHIEKVTYAQAIAFNNYAESICVKVIFSDSLISTIVPH